MPISLMSVFKFVLSVAGCADFVPSCRDVGSQFATGEFEDFGSVVNKARCWISQQQDVRVTNIQSIDYKLLHGTSNYSLSFANAFRINIFITIKYKK